jgi:hypothetical protein
MVSSRYIGNGSNTPSPKPSTPSERTVTIVACFSASAPNDVLNGLRYGSRMTRSSIWSIFMA